MLHFAGGMGFGVNVADLLELEGTFEGDGGKEVAGGEHDVIVVSKFFGQGLDMWGLLEGALNLSRQGTEGGHNFLALGERQVAHAAEMQAEQDLRDNLACKGLGGGNGYFRTNVEVNSPVDFAGHG